MYRLTEINAQNEMYSSQSTPLWLIQATILNCIGMLYNGNEKLKQSALKCFTDLVSSSETERLLRHFKQPGEGSRQMADWGSWVEDEMRRRTGYFIWVYLTLPETFLKGTFLLTRNSHNSFSTVHSSITSIPSRCFLWRTHRPRYHVKTICGKPNLKIVGAIFTPSMVVSERLKL